MSRPSTGWPGRSRRGTSVQVGKRWVVEAASSWMDDFGTIRRCAGRTHIAVPAHLDLAAAIVGALVRAARTCYRWDERPRAPRIC